MTITMEGALSKWTNVMKGWQYRWFVLDDSAGIFSYYTSKDKMTRGVRRGCVRLRGALIGIDDEVGTGLCFQRINELEKSVNEYKNFDPLKIYFDICAHRCKVNKQLFLSRENFS